MLIYECTFEIGYQAEISEICCVQICQYDVFFWIDVGVQSQRKWEKFYLENSFAVSATN